jgi:hypothetical protein
MTSNRSTKPWRPAGSLSTKVHSMIVDMGEYELWMALFKYSEANQLALMSEVDEA